MKAERKPLSPDETLDTFFHGRVSIIQKRRGYRFSVDAPLLADFIRTGPDDELLEIGTGSGVVSLLLSIKPFRRILALEIQPGLAETARRNVELNGLGGRIEVVTADLRTFDPGRRFDVVFSNPPYIRRGAGFLSPVDEKAGAKHELHCTLGEVTARTADWLKPSGRAYFIYPERRLRDFLGAAESAGLRPALLRHVRPRRGAAPNLFLAELRFGAVRTETLAPLVLFDEDGSYSEEARAIFAGRP